MQEKRYKLSDLPEPFFTLVYDVLFYNQKEDERIAEGDFEGEMYYRNKAENAEHELVREVLDAIRVAR